MPEMNRRNFLKVGLSGLAYFTAEATTPNWIIRSAQALPCNCLCDDRVLVIIQLAGGNDGLNTVIPRTDPVYYDAATRPTIRVPFGSELNLDGLNGLHPRLQQLADWYQQGQLAIINNVGYVNPDLSHFVSTDYWEYGSAPGQLKPTQGWIARFYDNACQGSAVDEAMFLAATGLSTVPPTFENTTGYTAPAIRSASTYSFAASQDRTLRLNAIDVLNQQSVVDSELDFIQRSENTAEASIADIATASSQPVLSPYPTGGLGDGLKLASQIIRAGFKTRIFYVSQGGYDTHAGQIATGDPLNAGDHPELLNTFNQAVNAFQTEMTLSNNSQRVLMMTFSEFGRRVQENGSLGTDHGAANNMFLLSGGINGGVYGGQPNLTDLIKGNLKHTIDFRSVYAQIIEGWFGGQASPVFGASTYNSIIQPDLAELGFIRVPTRASGWEKYY